MILIRFFAAYRQHRSEREDVLRTRGVRTAAPAMLEPVINIPYPAPMTLSPMFSAMPDRSARPQSADGPIVAQYTGEMLSRK